MRQRGTKEIKKIDKKEEEERDKMEDRMIKRKATFEIEERYGKDAEQWVIKDTKHKEYKKGCHRGRGKADKSEEDKMDKIQSREKRILQVSRWFFKCASLRLMPLK